MTAYEIDVDVLYPRDAAHRFRLYFRTGDGPGIPAATADSMAGIGSALAGLDDDAREAGLRGAVDLGVFGVLDAVEGRWIVLPWERPKVVATFGELPIPLAKGRNR